MLKNKFKVICSGLAPSKPTYSSLSSESTVHTHSETSRDTSLDDVGHSLSHNKDKYIALFLYTCVCVCVCVCTCVHACACGMCVCARAYMRVHAVCVCVFYTKTSSKCVVYN